MTVRRLVACAVRSCVLILFICAHPSCATDEAGLMARRHRMVHEHIAQNGVTNKRVLEAMRSTPRHAFLPADVRRAAYRDMALPIGFGQTISSPYIVARMTEQLDPQPSDRILEIGTGSGYQAAVLSSLVQEVFSIEIVPELAERSAETLRQLKYGNVTVRAGDGFQGWPAKAPFDKIMVTCSPEQIPQPLIDQLADGGRIVIPVGERYQQVLYRFSKVQGKLKKEPIESTFFVPMTGVAETERTKDTDATTQLANGGFESLMVNGEPRGWFYVRGGRVVQDPKSPQGTRCLQIKKSSAARAHALQPIGVNGENVKAVAVSFWSKGQGIQEDLLAMQSAQLVIEFYDEDRNICGDAMARVASGSFDWQVNRLRTEVPKDAKLAMVELGLFGASGTIYFDDVKLSLDSVP